MDEQFTDLKNSFFELMNARLVDGEQQYGDSFKTLDLINEIQEELVDVANYALLQFVKMELMRRKLL